MSSEDVYIAGIDMIKFGKYLDRSDRVPRRGEPLSAHMDDAGVTINDIEAHLQRQPDAWPWPWSASSIQQEIGQTGIPVDQLLERLRDGRDRASRGLDGHQGRPLRHRARRRRREAGGRRYARRGQHAPARGSIPKA